MRWVTRVVVVTALAVGLLAFSGVASATVTFTDGAKSEFKIDDAGNAVGDGGTLMSDAWRLFLGSTEGRRIFRWAQESSVVFTIDVLPEAQVGGGDAYGTAKITDSDGGEPSAIRLRIRNENVFSSSSVADTIWHEFRHGEFFVFGNNKSDHETLDGHTDWRNARFTADVARQVRAQRPTTTTTLNENPPTPHFDRIRKRTWQDDPLIYAAVQIGGILGDIRDSIKFNDATFADDYIDLEFSGTYKLSYTIEGVQAVYNESLLECGDREPDFIVVCADDGVLDMPPGDVLVGVMTMHAEIPLRGDVSLIYSLVADSDRDPANDWVAIPPFDWDIFQKTDRWYELIYDHLGDEWFLIVTQLNPDGSLSGVGQASSVRAVVAGDTVAFFVSMDEFPHPLPGVRLTTFGHDGFFSESFRGVDLNQADPTITPVPVGAEVFPTAPVDDG